MKRVCYLVLIAAVLLALGITVFAEDAPTSGKFSDTVSWKLEGGVLTLSGTGAVDSPFLDGYPWQSFRSSVQKVVAEEGITSIGYLCFSGCKNLTEIQFPNSLETIGQQALSQTQIKTLNIPQNVHTIGDGKKDAFAQIFIDTDALENIFVDDANTHYYDIDGVLFCRDSSVLVCFPREKQLDTYAVPEGITGIGNGAFAYACLTSIALPNSLKEIGPSAFLGTNLAEITIPDSVTRVGGYAFYLCKQLKHVTIPAGVENIENNTFQNCGSLETVTLLNPACLFRSTAGLFPKQTLLIGYKDSTLHQYAKAEGRNFRDIETGQTVNYYLEGGLRGLMPKNVAPSYPVDINSSLFETESGKFYGFYARIPIVTDTSDPTYQDIYNTTMEITKNCTTDREKAKAVMYWLSENFSYMPSTMGNDCTLENLYTLWNASPRKGNCEIFTQFTNFMLSILKIPNASASGKDHGWSLALIDGEWIPVDSTNCWFGATPYEEETSTIIFCVGDVVCVIDDFSGVKMTSYGKWNEDTQTTNDIYIPDYVTHIYETTFRYRKYAPGQEKVTIRGEKGSYAESYVRENFKDYSITYEGTKFTARPHVHTPGDYQKDSSQHWQVCTGCGDTLNRQSHSFDGCADTLCDTCGHTRSAAHNFTGAWQHDENGHWQKCAYCSAPGSVQGHAWDQGVPDGNVLRYTCTVCARQKTETVNTPTTVPPTTVPPTTVPPTTVPPTTAPPATVPSTTVPAVPDNTTVTTTSPAPSTSTTAPTQVTPQQTLPGQPAPEVPDAAPSVLPWAIGGAVLLVAVAAAVVLLLKKRRGM